MNEDFGDLSIDLSKKIEELHMLVTLFAGYKYFKAHDKLYSEEANTPKTLLKFYYSGKISRYHINFLTNSFINRYIKNECELEGVHNKEEIQGMKVMYDEMVNLPNDEFELFSLLGFHKALYSKVPFPECGGKLRNKDYFLLNTNFEDDPNLKPVELDTYDSIFTDLIDLEDYFNKIKATGIKMKENNDYSHLFDYVKACCDLNCKLVKIHPFSDGNGRTIRCLTNKLFITAGIPPVYINKKEAYEYRRGINEAINQDAEDNPNRLDSITSFYLYKICDSIIELDINIKEKELTEKLKQERAKRDGVSLEKKKNKKRSNLM